MRHLLIGLSALRVSVLLLMIHAGYAIFSDDGATRILLSEEWINNPFWHAQLSWQPLQFWIVGSLTKLTGLPAVEVALGCAIIATVVWPWLFAWSLPPELPRSKRKVLLIIVALMPWGLWTGVSGLVEPLMWMLALTAVGAWRHDRQILLGVALVLLTMTRLEGWILAACLALAWVWKKKTILPLVLAGIWPLLWHFVLGPGEHAVEMRQQDAITGYGSNGILRALLFPAIALLTCPAWIGFLWRRRAPVTLSGMGPLIGFVILFWLASIPVGLGTAVPQRNLVLPLLLISPLLVNGIRASGIIFILIWQCWTLVHPQSLLRDDLAAERNWLAATLVNLHSEDASMNVLVDLQSGAHAYLPRHLVIRGVSKEVLWTNYRPGRWQTNPRETWSKYMMYEEGSESELPLVNFWRSYKEENLVKDFREGFSKQINEATLRDNNISIIVTSHHEQWPQEFGLTLLSTTRDHALWMLGDPPAYIKPLELRPKVRSRRESLSEAWEKKRITRNSLHAIKELLGL